MYSFLKSGFCETDNNDILVEIMSIYMIFTEDALKISGLYTEHLNKQLVTDDVILKSLKIRAYKGEIFWNQPGMQQRIKKMEETLKNIMNGEETEEEYEEEFVEMDVENKNCNCELCQLFLTIDEKWNNWKPYEENEKRLKEIINNSENKFKETNFNSSNDL